MQRTTLTMATLTKKDLLEAIEDMPIDAKIMRRDFDFQRNYYDDDIVEVICSESNNAIILC